MAEAKLVVHHSYTLNLTMAEAVYLKVLLQNDLTDEGESDIDHKLRSNIWTALNLAGVKTADEALYTQSIQTLMEAIK